MIKLFTMICFYFFLPFSAIAYFGESSLSIKCSSDKRVDITNLKIEINYRNCSTDTILIPLDYLVYKNFQQIEFYKKEKIFCTSTVKMNWPTADTLKCNNKNMESIGFVILAPCQIVTKSFTLDELGCVGYKFAKGEKVFYRVSLTIDEKFKNFCTNVWTGDLISNMGSFIVE